MNTVLATGLSTASGLLLQILQCSLRPDVERVLCLSHALDGVDDIHLLLVHRRVTVVVLMKLSLSECVHMQVRQLE